MEDGRIGNISYDRVIAERSSWVAGGAVLLWVVTVFFIGIIAAISAGMPGLFPILLIPLILVPFAIWYTYELAVTPTVLAGISGGVLYLCPNKKTRTAVDPASIKYIGQKNYSGRGITYSSGKLTIETYSGEILLRWVRDADDVRRALEDLRTKAQQAVARQRYAQQQQMTNDGLN